MSLDPTFLAIVQNNLQNICAEMDLVHVKTSFSPIISEALDRANGIYALESGLVIAQGHLGLPIFMGVMQATTKGVIDTRQDLNPGDVIVVNDPYLGGTHLMDVKMVRPFFYKGKLWAYLANTGHWPDTGGMVPGGFNATAREIHQEGLRLPPTKLFKNDQLDEDILSIILANIRVPDERIGDIMAQVGALRVGERRLTALLDKYGPAEIERAIVELGDRSERQMRDHISKLPDGTYYATAYMDSDGIVNEPLAVKLKMTVRASDIEFDLSESSPPCKGPMNSVWAATQAAVYVAMKHIFPDVPVNIGCFRPIHVVEPRNTFLYAEYPRPVAGCAAEVSQRVLEAVFIAMGQIMPERMFGIPFGTSGNLSIGGYDPERKRAYIMYYFAGGGYGGWWEADGLSNGCSGIGISKQQPVEIMEQRYPVHFENFSLREDSAGAGKYRGGFGVSYRVRLTRGEGVASFLMEHGRFGPMGLLGGGEGATNKITVSQGGRSFEPPHLSKGDGYHLAPGDAVEVHSPGGGGYGDPKERDPALIARDARRGYFSPEVFERDYGAPSKPAD